MVASEEAIDKGRENDIVANGIEMGGSSKAVIENDVGLDGLEEMTMGDGRVHGHRRRLLWLKSHSPEMSSSYGRTANEATVRPPRRIQLISVFPPSPRTFFHQVAFICTLRLKSSSMPVREPAIYFFFLC
jgi:hypothetical protein